MIRNSQVEFFSALKWEPTLFPRDGRSSLSIAGGDGDRLWKMSVTDVNKLESAVASN